MGKRGKTSQAPGYYASRNKSGQFTGFVNIGKSINADKRKKSKTHPKTPGHGNQGDYK